MRFFKKFLLVTGFLCLMAAGVGGVLYVEQETPWIEDFKYAVGLKKDEKPKGITFAGNKIGNQRLQKRRDDAFIATLKHMFGGGGPMMREQQAAIVAKMESQIGAMEAFEMPDMPTESRKSKKTHRSGSLGF